MWSTVILVVIFAVVVVICTLYVNRPRAQKIEALPAPLEETRKVAVVVVAPEEDDGLNQYSLPTLDAWCTIHGYDFIVEKRGTHVQHMIRLTKDKKYDYLIGVSNRIILVTKKESLDHVFSHTTLAASFEDCFTSWFCSNITRAWTHGDISQAFGPSMNPSFLIVNANNPDAVKFLQRTSETGYIDRTFSVSALPVNLIGNHTDWNTVSNSKALLGYLCARSDQMKPIFDNLSYSGTLRSVSEIHGLS